MMCKFLQNHRSDLMERCKDKVAARPQRAATEAQLANRAPTFFAATDKNAPFTVDEFRTLIRCLDNAIADAVLEFSSQRDVRALECHNDETRVRVGFLAHELRNAVATATLAVGALEFGNMNTGGATGAVLKRSLASLTVLINRAGNEVRIGLEDDRSIFPVASLSLMQRVWGSVSVQIVALEVEGEIRIERLKFVPGPIPRLFTS